MAALDDMMFLDSVIENSNRLRRAREAQAYAEQSALEEAIAAQGGGGSPLGAAAGGAGTLGGLYLANKGIGALAPVSAGAPALAGSSAPLNMAALDAMGIGSAYSAMGAGPTLANAATLPATSGGAAPAAAGLSPWAVAGPLAFVGSAPIWAPKVAKTLGGFFEGVLGGDANRVYDPSEILGLQKNDPKRQAIFEAQVPGWGGFSDAQKTGVLNKANELGILNLPGQQGKPSREAISLNLLTKRMGMGGNTKDGQFGDKYTFQNLDKLINDLEKKKFVDEDPNSRRSQNVEFLRFLNDQRAKQYDGTKYLADLMGGVSGHS